MWCEDWQLQKIQEGARCHNFIKLKLNSERNKEQKRVFEGYPFLRVNADIIILLEMARTPF
jgi:hypothetical protein